MHKFHWSIIFILSLVVFNCWSEKNSEATKTTKPKTETSKPKTTASKTDPIPPEQLAKAKEMLAAISEADINGVNAKDKFNMLCSVCHGTNGKLKMAGATDLSASTTSMEESVVQIYFGKGTMTPFKGIMTDAEIIAVAMYLEIEIRD